MSPLDRTESGNSASKTAEKTAHSGDNNETSPEDSMIRNANDLGKDHHEDYNESNMNVSDDLLTVSNFVGNETQGGANDSETNKTGNDEDDDNVEDIGKFSIESISNIANIDHISIDQMNGIDNIDNIDGIEITNLHGQNIISEQQDFPTIEVIKTVQRNRKKRQFSTIEDEEMSRLEFQQWTSGFLADDLEDPNVEVSIDDVEYGFPQTTAAHFTDVVDDQSNNALTGKKRKLERKGQVRGNKPEKEQLEKVKAVIEDRKNNMDKNDASFYIKHEGEEKGGAGVPSEKSTAKVEQIHKIVNEVKDGGRHEDSELADKEEDNVDPELANIDTNAFVHDAMLDARALVSLNTLDYLRNRNDGEDARVNEEDDENLAVEAVNRAVNQAVAAVHASRGGEIDRGRAADDNDNAPDADVIAAAVVAAENSVRKQIQNAGLGSHGPGTEKHLFDLFQKEHQKQENDDVDGVKSTNVPLVTEHGIKNNKVMSKAGAGSKRSTRRKKEVKVEESKESLLEKEMISDAISKAQRLISDQPKGRSFTKEETDAIEVFIKEYEVIHSISHEQFLQRIWGNERKKDKFWEILHSVLPNRTRSSLYKHVRRTYHIFEKRGVWTAEEDVKLAELAKTCEGKWRLIGEQLKRMPEDCRDRWRNYVKCGAKRNVNQWTIHEEFKLKSIVAKVLEEERQKMRPKVLQEAGPDLRQAREAQVSPTINWTTISELMGGTRSRIQCRYKWKKIMKNESVKKLREMNHDTKLWMLHSIKRLSENDPNIEANLDWNALALSVPESYTEPPTEEETLSKKEQEQEHEQEQEQKQEPEPEPESPQVTWNGVDLATCFQRLRATVDAKERGFVETVDLLIAALSASSYVDRLDDADAIDAIDAPVGAAGSAEPAV